MSKILTVEQRLHTIRDFLKANQGQLKGALTHGLDEVRFLNTAWIQVQLTPALAYCTSESYLRCLITCAQLGLYPDGVSGYAYLIPRKIKGTETCTFQIGYQGIVELFRQSGVAAERAAEGRVVYENDTFDYEYGDTQFLKHKPTKEAEPGDPIAYYGMLRFKHDSPLFEVITLSQAEHHRDRFAPRNKDRQIVGPWISDFDAMAIKSCLRKCGKLAPGPELRKAIAYDERGEVGVEQDLQEADKSGKLIVVPQWDIPEGQPTPDRAKGDQPEAPEPEPQSKAAQSLKDKMKAKGAGKGNGNGNDKKDAKAKTNAPKGSEPPPPDDDDAPPAVQKANGKKTEQAKGDRSGLPFEECAHGNDPNECHKCADAALAKQG